MNNPLYSGSKQLTSEIVILSDSVELRWGVHLIALSSNTDLIYVLGPDRTIADGFPLEPGDRLELRIDDPSKIYLSAVVGGGSGPAPQELRWLAW
jgi:hypothetical protein